MWFLKTLFIFICILASISAFLFLLRYYGSAVKVYLVLKDREPKTSSASDWAKAERQRLKDLESLPDEMKKP